MRLFTDNCVAGFRNFDKISLLNEIDVSEIRQERKGWVSLFAIWSREEEK